METVVIGSVMIVDDCVGIKTNNQGRKVQECPHHFDKFHDSAKCSNFGVVYLSEEGCEETDDMVNAQNHSNILEVLCIFEAILGRIWLKSIIIKFFFIFFIKFSCSFKMWPLKKEESNKKSEMYKGTA